MFSQESIGNMHKAIFCFLFSFPKSFMDMSPIEFLLWSSVWKLWMDIWPPYKINFLWTASRINELLFIPKGNFQTIKLDKLLVSRVVPKRPTCTPSKKKNADRDSFALLSWPSGASLERLTWIGRPEFSKDLHHWHVSNPFHTFLNHGLASSIKELLLQFLLEL